jgi:protein-disulfide isomerase
VRLVLKDLPVLGPASVLGARALQAAERQGGYLKMQAALMGGSPDITEATLRDASQQAGLDWARLQRDMMDPAIQSKLNANLAMARSLGIDGTPSFVIGNQLIPGAIDQNTMSQLVAQARRG